MKRKKSKGDDGLRRKAETTIRKYSLVEPGDRVLVAVSGGPDSIALLSILADLGGTGKFHLAAAYFNHGLRKQAENEARWVAEKAKSFGVPFFSGKAETETRVAKDRSPQERARLMRYRFFRNTAKREGYNKVAFGHTSTDQAETVLLYIARGTGRGGLAGIPPKRVLEDTGGEVTVIRPLIECTREEVMSYLNAVGAEWLEDESNLKTDYLRNRIRHLVLPVIRREINPQIEGAVTRVSGILRGEERLLEELSTQAFTNCRIRVSSGFALSVERLAALIPPVRRRVLRMAVSEVVQGIRPPGFRVIEELESLLAEGRPNRRISLPGGIRAERVYEKLHFFSREGIPEGSGTGETYGRLGFPNRVDGYEEDWEIEVPVPGEVSIPVPDHTPIQKIRLEVIPRSELDTFPDGKRRAVIDWERVRSLPLVIRAYRPGDRFHPLGAPGKKKLKKYFIENRVPVSERKSTLVLVSGGDIVWVAGHRIDDRYRITENTRNVLTIAVV